MKEGKTPYRQLLMKLEPLPPATPLPIPDGWHIRAFDVSSGSDWEEIVESAFGTRESFADKLNRPGLVPERCQMVYIGDEAVATAASYDHLDYPGYAFLHMVAAKELARGKGAGKLAVLAVLQGLAELELRGCVLTTDDFRLPAIGLYLSLGFCPVIRDADMQARWGAVYQNLKKH